MDKQTISVRSIFYGSDGSKTRSLLRQLEARGWLGQVAAQLFRAQKYSSRAKVYRGGVRGSSDEFLPFRDLAYKNKEKAMIGLCSLLSANDHEIKWGWRDDPSQPFAKHVLYVDLPNGQVSFHALSRLRGPDYHGQWDGSRGSERRIIEFCQSILQD